MKVKKEMLLKFFLASTLFVFYDAEVLFDLVAGGQLNQGSKVQRQQQVGARGTTVSIPHTSLATFRRNNRF